MIDIIEILATVDFWSATLRIVSPLVFATLGELLCERAGELNLGIEGIMTVGTLAGWMRVHQGGGLWGGVAFAALVGAALSAQHRGDGGYGAPRRLTQGAVDALPAGRPNLDA